MKSLPIILVFILYSSLSMAQQSKGPLNYGEPISLESAKKMAAASEAFAVKNQWTIVVAIVDTGGNIVLVHRMDNTQIGSVDVALGKARTANNFKRSTKIFEDAVAGGGAGVRILGIEGVYPIEGGEPIIINGKIIGGIGVSGMSSSQDGEALKAGLAALLK